MKSLFCFCLCMVSLLTACSSHKKGQNDDIQVITKDSVVTDSLQRMPISDSKVLINYKGKQYHSTVLRKPDEGLPIVVNDEGSRFVDNRILLKIVCDGKVVLDKAFTKQSFASFVDQDFLDNAILDGLVYDKITPQGLQYAASLCYPQTDLYIPLSVTVTQGGKISMAKEELIEDLYDSSTDSVK